MAIAYWNKHDYVVKLRQRLNKPTTWKDWLNVKYSNVRTIVNGVISTEPAPASGTRNSYYSWQQNTLTQDTLTIDQYYNMPVFIDEADRYQQSYCDQMSMADFQGRKIDELLESMALAQYTAFADFGVGDLAGSSSGDTTQLTVSATNIDDIIRAIKRKIYTANGVELAISNGFFFVWRPQDYEFLEAFVQANGFSEADVALKNGISVGMRYMGADHYLTTSNTANHLVAGVKRIYDLGILTGTYGKVKFIEDPVISTSNASGLGVVSRVDWGFAGSVPNLTLIQDVNVT